MTDSSLVKQRLIDAALQVFASKGYEGASTREICRLAEANVAAVHYYFGDKASLYRELFQLPEELRQLPALIDDPAADTRAVLVSIYRHSMAYLTATERVQLLRLLYIREQMQPSNVVDDGLDSGIELHHRLTAFLCRAIDIPEVDTAVHQLAFGIGGLALILFIQRGAVNAIAPELMADDAAVSATIERLADQGMALISAERARRATAPARASTRTPGGAVDARRNAANARIAAKRLTARRAASGLRRT